MVIPIPGKRRGVFNHCFLKSSNAASPRPEGGGRGPGLDVNGILFDNYGTTTLSEPGNRKGRHEETPRTRAFGDPISRALVAGPSPVCGGVRRRDRGARRGERSQRDRD